MLDRCWALVAYLPHQINKLASIRLVFLGDVGNPIRKSSREEQVLSFSLAALFNEGIDCLNVFLETHLEHLIGFI